MEEKLSELLSDDILRVWKALVCEVDLLYDVDKSWDKGFGGWDVEYKYRRGGKTLCTFYAKKGAASILVTYGKTERQKFEEIKDTVSRPIQSVYEQTQTLHDGKWLWIPLDDSLVIKDVLTMLKIKRKPNRIITKGENT